MQSLIKEEKGLKRQLELLVPAKEVGDCFSKNSLQIQKKAKISGFRQGKVPLSVVRKNYKNQIHKAVMEDLFQSFYSQALKTNQLHPAGPPTLLDLQLEEGQNCKFLLELEVHPQISIQNTELELKKKEVSVTDKELNETLEKIRQSCAKFEDSPNKGPLKKGDFFTLNLFAFSKPKKEKKLNYSDILLMAGENRLAVGFDDQLLGLNQNEEKEFDFYFPPDHPDSSVAGLNLQVKTKVTGFKEKKIPELNDELAQRFKVQTLEELKLKVKKDLKNNLEQRAKEELENKAIQQLLEKNPVDLPLVLVKEQKERLKDNARRRLEEYKMPKLKQEEFIQGKDNEFEKEAKDSLRISYLMNQLIKDFKIENSKEDIQRSLKESFSTKKPEDMEEELKKNGYWNSFLFNLSRQKVISLLIEKAKITTE